VTEKNAVRRELKQRNFIFNALLIF